MLYFPNTIFLEASLIETGISKELKLETWPGENLQNPTLRSLCPEIRTMTNSFNCLLWQWHWLVNMFLNT